VDLKGKGETKICSPRCQGEEVDPPLTGPQKEKTPSKLEAKETQALLEKDAVGKISIENRGGRGKHVSSKKKYSMKNLYRPEGTRGKVQDLTPTRAEECLRSKKRKPCYPIEKPL